MPTMQGSISVAANSVSTNVLSGQLYEFVPAGANITLSVTGSAAGLNTTFINGVPLVNDQEINTQNRYPLIPDDVLHGGRVPGGRMVLTFRNTTAGALTARWRIDI